jgi:hypothetical protein
VVSTYDVCCLDTTKTADTSTALYDSPLPSLDNYLECYFRNPFIEFSLFGEISKINGNVCGNALAYWNLDNEMFVLESGLVNGNTITLPFGRKLSGIEVVTLAGAKDIIALFSKILIESPEFENVLSKESGLISELLIASPILIAKIFAMNQDLFIKTIIDCGWVEKIIVVDAALMTEVLSISSTLLAKAYLAIPGLVEQTFDEFANAPIFSKKLTQKENLPTFFNSHKLTKIPSNIEEVATAIATVGKISTAISGSSRQFEEILCTDSKLIAEALALNSTLLLDIEEIPEVKQLIKQKHIANTTSLAMRLSAKIITNPAIKKQITLAILNNPILMAKALDTIPSLAGLISKVSDTPEELLKNEFAVFSALLQKVRTVPSIQQSAAILFTKTPSLITSNLELLKRVLASNPALIAKVLRAKPELLAPIAANPAIQRLVPIIFKENPALFEKVLMDLNFAAKIAAVPALQTLVCRAFTENPTLAACPALFRRMLIFNLVLPSEIVKVHEVKESVRLAFEKNKNLAAKVLNDVPLKLIELNSGLLPQLMISLQQAVSSELIADTLAANPSFAAIVSKMSQIVELSTNQESFIKILHENPSFTEMVSSISEVQIQISKMVSLRTIACPPAIAALAINIPQVQRELLIWEVQHTPDLATNISKNPAVLSLLNADNIVQTLTNNPTLCKMVAEIPEVEISPKTPEDKKTIALLQQLKKGKASVVSALPKVQNLLSNPEEIMAILTDNPKLAETVCTLPEIKQIITPELFLKIIKSPELATKIFSSTEIAKLFFDPKLLLETLTHDLSLAKTLSSMHQVQALIQDPQSLMIVLRKNPALAGMVSEILQKQIKEADQKFAAEVLTVSPLLCERVISDQSVQRSVNEIFIKHLEIFATEKTELVAEVLASDHSLVACISVAPPIQSIITGLASKNGTLFHKIFNKELTVINELTSLIKSVTPPERKHRWFLMHFLSNWSIYLQHAFDTSGKNGIEVALGSKLTLGAPNHKCVGNKVGFTGAKTFVASLLTGAYNPNLIYLFVALTGTGCDKVANQRLALNFQLPEENQEYLKHAMHTEVQASVLICLNLFHSIMPMSLMLSLNDPCWSCCQLATIHEAIPESYLFVSARCDGSVTGKFATSKSPMHSQTCIAKSTLGNLDTFLLHVFK